MEQNEKLAEFFRTECDYTSLLQEIIAAQAQMLNIYDKIETLPRSERPATNRITDMFFLLSGLSEALEPTRSFNEYKNNYGNE